MKAGRGVRAIVGVLTVIVLLCGWYVVAANYDYEALAGTYVLTRNGEKCILKLRSDQTFSEEIDRSGNLQIVRGQWRRYGESHVSFSSEFLKLAGQELNESGEAHGQFDKTLGIFPFLVLAPLPDGPTLRKHLFR